MIIGLTGGIGAGKSTVSNYLRSKGLTIVDADLVSRQVVEPGSEALTEIAKTFGTEYLNEDGTLARRKLGQLVFSDKNALWKLEYILSNKIGEEIHRQLNESETGITVLDAATLIEAGYESQVDVLWVVDTDDETRIKRVMERDGISREEVIDRMNNQMSREERLDRDCVVLDSTGTPDIVFRQIDEILTEYQKL